MGRSKIILHLGRHKCGTTAIQKALSNNRELLASHGYFYPPPPGNDIAHHVYARPLTNARFGQLADSRRRLSHFRARLGVLRQVYRRGATGRRGSQKTHNPRPHASVAEMNAFTRSLAEAAPQCAVLSSEVYQNCQPVRVMDCFRHFDVHPVCYLREQTQYLRSSYAQRIHASDYLGSVADYYEEVFQAEYDRYLQRWSDCFGERLQVRLFERESLEQGDAVQDFMLRVLQLKPDVVGATTLPAHENPTPGAEVLAFKLELNRRGYQLSPDIYRVLVEIDEPGAPAFGISQDLAARVQERFEKGNRKVARRYFGRDTLFAAPPVKQATADLNISEARFKELLQRVQARAPGCAVLTNGSAATAS
jgi:hypothetical protein